MSKEMGRTAALAGLLQSCMQVRNLARNGAWEDEAVAPCIHSLFQMDAGSVEEIYGSYQGLQSGLSHLKKLLLKQVERTDLEVSRYALTLLHLEKKLSRDSNMLDKIRQGLYAIRNEFDIDDINHATLQSRIADLYVETVSTISPKVQVEGEREHLTQLNNTWRVRTLLFCGMRSAVLWKQLGGSRWGLFLHRRRILRTIDHMLEM